MNDCCEKNLDKAQRIGRAKYVCPVCKTDVTIALMFYLEAMENSN